MSANFATQFRLLQTAIETAAQTGLVEAAELVKKEAQNWLGHEHSEWPPLAEKTVEEKIHTGGAGPLIRTGALRDSIEARVEGMNAEIGTNHEYAVYLEHGTSKMPPRPFLAPALMTKANEVRDIIRQHISHAIKQLG